MPDNKIRSCTALIIFLMAAGCGMMRPTGLLGISWGDNANQAALKLGLACSKWTAWEGGQGFQVCRSYEKEVPVFGEPAYVRLVRGGVTVEGIQATFRDCEHRWSSLQNAVARDFLISTDTNGPYTVWSSGEVVRLSRDKGDNTCQLTVAGPIFGKAYSQDELRHGLSGLFRIHH